MPRPPALPAAWAAWTWGCKSPRPAKEARVFWRGFFLFADQARRRRKRGFSVIIQRVASPSPRQVKANAILNVPGRFSARVARHRDCEFGERAAASQHRIVFPRRERRRRRARLVDFGLKPSHDLDFRALADELGDTRLFLRRRRGAGLHGVLPVFFDRRLHRRAGAGARGALFAGLADRGFRRDRRAHLQCRRRLALAVGGFRQPARRRDDFFRRFSGDRKREHLVDFGRGRARAFVFGVGRIGGFFAHRCRANGGFFWRSSPRLF